MAEDQRMRNNPRDRRRQRSKEDEFERNVISIRRVAKVRAGAKRLRFSVVVAVGDRKGRVCVALGRGGDTKSAINKAIKYGSEHLTKIDLIGDTIPHEVRMKYGAAKIMLKPAGVGTGVIASGPIRAVMQVAGVRNVLSKQFGSNNHVTNAYCAFEALKSLDKRRIQEKRTQKARSTLTEQKGETTQTTVKKK